MDQILVKSIHQLSQSENGEEVNAIPAETKTKPEMTRTKSKSSIKSKQGSIKGKDQGIKKPKDLNEIHDVYYALIDAYVENYERYLSLYQVAQGARMAVRLSTKANSRKNEK